MYRTGSSPEQIAPTLGCTPDTVRRWTKDLRLAKDSEILTFVSEKTREFVVLCAQNAVDAALAVATLIRAGDAKGAQHMSMTQGIQWDKAQLAASYLSTGRIIDHEATAPELIARLGDPQDPDTTREANS